MRKLGNSLDNDVVELNFKTVTLDRGRLNTTPVSLF